MPHFDVNTNGEKKWITNTWAFFHFLTSLCVFFFFHSLYFFFFFCIYLFALICSDGWNALSSMSSFYLACTINKIWVSFIVNGRKDFFASCYALLQLKNKSVFVLNASRCVLYCTALVTYKEITCTFTIYDLILKSHMKFNEQRDEKNGPKIYILDLCRAIVLPHLLAYKWRAKFIGIMHGMA